MDGNDDGLLAVVAHSLLGSVAACRAAAHLLRHDDRDDDRSEELFAVLDDQTAHLASVLSDLVRSGPAAVVDALDDLSGPG